VHNPSANPNPQDRWQWTPSRAIPSRPGPGGSAPQGDIPELIRHLGRIRAQGATVGQAEQTWVDGMRLIDQRAAQFPGNARVVNDFYGTVSGEWRVYVGRAALPGKDSFAIALNTRTGGIARGYYPSGIRPHPMKPGQEALFNFQVIYP